MLRFSGIFFIENHNNNNDYLYNYNIIYQSIRIQNIIYLIRYWSTEIAMSLGNYLHI